MKRFFRRLRWILFGGSLHLIGCAHNSEPPKVPTAELLEMSAAAGCKVAIDRHIADAHTCDEAQLWTNADPDCAKFAPLDFRCRTHK